MTAARGRASGCALVLIAPTLIVAGLLAASPAAAAELLSLRNLTRGAGEYVARFSVTVSNATVLAVCRVPRGWSIGATDRGNGDGALTAEAVPGVAPLQNQRTADFDNLFLIDQPEPVAHPARFRGTAMVGTRGGASPPRERPIDRGNIVLEPAERCP